MKALCLFVLIFSCLEGHGKAVEAPVIRDAQKIARDACNQFPKIQATGGRILYGNVAEYGEFPWVARLSYVDHSKISFLCGGTLISEYYIMTAAHCLSRPPLYVRLGKIDDEPTGDMHFDYYIESVIKHPNYSRLTKKNDIALTKVKKPILFTNTIRPACLHTDLGDLDTTKKLIVTSWNGEGPSSQSNGFTKFEYNTKPLNECSSFYLNISYFANTPSFPDGLSPGQYCITDLGNIRDSCQGDSGGPLQYYPNDDPNNATVVGIVSFGMSCGHATPGICTRVAYYLDWIVATVWPQN